MKGKKLFITSVAMVAITLWGCGNGEQQPQNTTQQEAKTPPRVQAPVFDADTAYHYVAKQLAFGPRVPGTKAQVQCAAWMEAELTKTCDTVYRQETKVKAGNGQMLP